MTRTLAGRYRIGQLLGRGGMAVVHEAHDVMLDRAVAVKLLLPHLGEDATFVERFRREARAAAGLNHPNIVAVHDTGDDGAPFIVMELVRGRSLDQVLAAGDVDRRQLLSVLADACAALDHAHGRGLVHRDVKPANILLTDEGEVKVADFGIARAAGTDTLTVTSVLGTAAYLSPEQARGDEVDRRADLYALGVVLYEAVTGAPPFRGPAVQVALRHVADDPAPPSEVADVAADLEAVILTCLAKDPGDRYPTAAALRADLLALRDGRPITADRDAARAAAGHRGGAGTVRVGAPAHRDATAVLPPDTIAVDRGGAADVVAAAAAATGEAAPGEARPGTRQPPTPTRRPWLGLAAVLLLGVLATAVASSQARLAVPDLTGLTRDRALAEAERAGLTIARIDQRPDEAFPAGHVAATSPRAGTVVREGHPLVIAVSTGPPPGAEASPVAEAPPPDRDVRGEEERGEDGDRGGDEDERDDEGGGRGGPPGEDGRGRGRGRGRG